MLGHIVGIGQNVRGIRREADRNLAGTGWQIQSKPTIGEDGKRLPWATYELVHAVLQRRLEATERRVRECVSGSATRQAGEQGRMPF